MLLALAAEHAPSMNAQQASNVLWALGTLRQWSHEVVEALGRRFHSDLMGSATLLDHAQALWAFGELRFVPTVRPPPTPLGPRNIACHVL